MKVNSEKSTLNDYHKERNRIACLAVEEMLKHPTSLEEMKEQTKRIMTDVNPEERGIVFEIGGEGGSICISKKRNKQSSVFIIFKNETDFSDEGLSENLKSRHETFESAFDSINQQYSLHMLSIMFIHDEYKDYVSSELLKKLNEKKVSFDGFQNRTFFEEQLGVEFEFDKSRNNWKTSINVDKIVSYLREVINATPLEERYNWQFKLDEDSIIPIELNDYNKCIWLRKNFEEIMSALYRNTDKKEFINKYQWIISKWGGIKLGDVSKLDNLVNTFIDNKNLGININFERISSVSKVGAFMFPHECVIYDSRVAFSLNWILLSQGITKKFFPIPEGRNSEMMRFDVNVIINLIFKGDIAVLIPKNEAYNKMNELIIKINNKLWDTIEERKNIYLTEMLLFSIADNYIIDDIKNRIHIELT